MRAIDRLKQLKQEIEQDTTAQKFVSLTNPKNVTLMESLVAWTCSEINFLGQEEVQPNATMNDLWQLSDVNVKNFADTAGIDITQGISKLKQLKNLSLIFPDGTALSKAISIVKVYVKGKIEDL